MHILFPVHKATECVCVHISVSILHLFHFFCLFLFHFFLILKLVGTQVEVYANCVFSVLTGQFDSSDQDDKRAFLDLASILSGIFFLAATLPCSAMICVMIVSRCAHWRSLMVVFGQQVLALLMFLLQTCTML